MARKVFYSFHYKRDAWRASQVRNSNALADDDEFGVIDSVAWETIERQGDAAIERWINDQLKHTTVTVVLIGAETAERDWVDYEIRQSWKRGNALLGVRIHQCKDQDQKTDAAGPNPLEQMRLADGTALSSIFKTYDWISDDGRANLSDWVEDAYQQREKYSGVAELAEAKAGPSRGPTIITAPAAPWAF